jgi:hypothetical protein
VITGQVVVGAQPVRVFDAAIDKAIAEGAAQAGNTGKKPAD